MKWKVLGCSAALLVSTCALAQVPDADTQEGKEMQIQIHSYMSEHPTVSIDEAITRLAVQGEVMSDIEALRIEFADRLTELSIKDAPDQHILVQLKGQIQSRIERLPPRAGRPVWCSRLVTSTPRTNFTRSLLSTDLFFTAPYQASRGRLGSQAKNGC